MTELLRLQRQFQGYLLDPDADGIPDVLGSDRADAATRSSIYASAYRSRLIEALQSNFPMLASWMGERGFTALGLAYLSERPSRCRSIRYFGDGLGDFLAQARPWRRRPALAEMARLEWALAAAFDAADADCVGADQMRALRPEQWAHATFIFHPSVRCLDHEWNVVQIWKSCGQGVQPCRARRIERRTWLIWRRTLEIHFRSLTRAETAALDVAIDGRTFADVCERLCAYLPAAEIASQAATWLREWLDSGLISEIRTADITPGS